MMHSNFPKRAEKVLFWLPDLILSLGGFKHRRVHVQVLDWLSHSVSTMTPHPGDASPQIPCFK